MIVGLTGPNAAGKGEISRFLALRGYAVHSLADVVREAARAQGRTITRATLIEVGQELRCQFGPGVLAQRLLPRLIGRSVVDSIRSPAEVDVLRGAPHFFLLGVDAPVELRWRRATARAREGEAPDLVAFIAAEERENGDHPESQQLRRALALADVVVLNDGALVDLQQRVGTVVERWERQARS